jgi:hypothetical protein
VWDAVSLGLLKETKPRSVISSAALCLLLAAEKNCTRTNPNVVA